MEKGQQNIFTCFHTLQARIYFPITFKKLNTKQQGVPLLWGRNITGGTELFVPCIPAKSGNFTKYIFGWLGKWIVPIFHKKPQTPQQYLPASSERGTSLTHPPNNPLTQLPRTRLTSLTIPLQMATFQKNCCFVTVYEMTGKKFVQKYCFTSVSDPVMV